MIDTVGAVLSMVTVIADDVVLLAARSWAMTVNVFEPVRLALAVRVALLKA